MRVHRPHTTDRRCRGFTLVELLTVIAIIVLLIALLFPAMQSMRETARRGQCSNNVKQFASAALSHELAQRHLPSGGWGSMWVGDGDRGFGSSQPGGWVYSSLPYMEQKVLWDMPVDGAPNQLGAAQLAGATQMCRAPLTMANCPSRRPAKRFPEPANGTQVAYNAADNSSDDNTVARCDYAANGGATMVSSLIDWTGPAATVNLANPRPAGDTSWPDRNAAAAVELNGVVFACSQIQSDSISDGASNTYLLGERYIDPGQYETGTALGDDGSWSDGSSNDLIRTAGWAPRQDTRGIDNGAELWFGGPHASSFCMALADGAVVWVSYSIDPAAHRMLANRFDGGVIPGNALR